MEEMALELAIVQEGLEKKLGKGDISVGRGSIWGNCPGHSIPI